MGPTTSAPFSRCSPSTWRRLFQPQIARLLTARDRRVAGWAATHPDADAYEDHDLEVTSAVEISIDDQVGAVVAALEAKSG